MAAGVRRGVERGKGVYAEPVAEMALALMLAGLRNLQAYARADRWTGPVGTDLLGAPVTIFGGGGISESLLRLLAPFGCDVTVVRKRRAPGRGRGSSGGSPGSKQCATQQWSCWRSH